MSCVPPMQKNVDGHTLPALSEEPIGQKLPGAAWQGALSTDPPSHQ